MKFYEWAYKWNIPKAAIDEWVQTLNLVSFDSNNGNKLSEAAILNLVRVEASKKGCRLWRNNLGAAYLRDGTFLRYGLANESSGMNKQIKSADLIGIRPVKITEKMIGVTIGQFISREIKKTDWKYKGDEREKAQLNWAELILSMGGDACFATKEGTL